MTRLYYIKGLTLLYILLTASIVPAQNVGINTDGSLPNANAILDIKSKDKGLLIPRMDSNTRKSIDNTIGLLVYDSTYHSFWYNTGSSWQNIATGSGWSLSGNNSTGGSLFLGTLDFSPLSVRVNNKLSGFIGPDVNTANTFWGYESGSSITTGISNTATGCSALSHNTTGEDNTAGGSQSLSLNTTGNNNTATGSRTMFFNTTGNFNTANGLAALYLNRTGRENTAVGGNAMFNNTTGSFNTCIGIQTLFWNDIGNYNTALGNESLMQNRAGRNTGIGYQSLYSNTSGNENVAAGVESLHPNTTGSGNTAVGTLALSSNISGSTNTAIGKNANVATGNLNNATVIGANATVNASNKVRIGNAAVTVIEGQVPFTTPSDGRFKFDMQEDVKGLDFILRLRPLTYRFDVNRFDAQFGVHADQAVYNEAAQIRRTGFIAQEVEKAAIASGYNFSGIIKPKTDKDHYGLSYESFVVPLVKAVQEQEQFIENQNKKIEQQDKKLATLQQQVEKLIQLLQSQKINK